MAAIGKIRENSTFLLIIIGGAMVAFILGDFLSGGSRTPDAQYVGEVAGEDINMVDYDQRVQDRMQSSQMSGQPMTEQRRNMIRNQVWQNMVKEKVMHTQLNDLGMRITQEEYDDIRFGENIRQRFKSNPIFKNPKTGQFDPNRVRQYFSTIQQQYPTVHRLQQTQLVNNRLYEKYNSLVKKGMHANPVDARNGYMVKNNKVNFEYVVKKFGSVADSTLDLSEDALREYYDEHSSEDRFQEDAAANISYAVFKVENSEDDALEIKKNLATYKKDFAEDRDDSTFIARNSDTKRFKPFKFIAPADSNSNPGLKEKMANAKVGDVVGPYKDGNYLKIAKVTGEEKVDQARVRHILLKKGSAKDKQALKARGDSLKRVVQSQDNFEEMVQEFSQDPGSKSNGGVYDWFGRDKMAKPFTRASFKSEGTISVVETRYGVHVVEVLGRRENPVKKVLTIAKEIKPSSDTFDKVYDKASGVSINSDNLKQFKKNAKEAGVALKTEKNLKRNEQVLAGIPRSRKVVRWANNEEIETGTVSEAFEAGDNFVVAVVTSRHKAGTADFEEVRDLVKREVARDKKAEKFEQNMQGNDLSKIAEAVNSQVKTARNISGDNTTLSGGLNEPYVAGVAITLEKGQISVPLKGENGVYVVKATKKTMADEQEDYSFARGDVEKTFTNRVSTINGATYRALKDLAGVKDQRGKYY